MTRQLSDFLGGYQRGIEVAVAGGTPDELLGIREAFRRYFHDALDRPVPVAVVPQESARRLRGLAESDAAALAAARTAARELASRLGPTYQFYVALEACIETFDDAGETVLVLRSWSVVSGPPGEARGASGSLELPRGIVERVSRQELVAGALPATRRSGGWIASLTGGLETRRSAVALSTLNALSTLFYGILESRPGLRR